MSNRKIITFLNNTLSEEYSINNGVPQGSLIGPILFAIFINDLASLFDKCSFHLYADDTVLYYSDKDPQVVESVLNDELNKVIKWMDKNKLKLNCTKTVGMLLGTKHMLSKHSNLHLKINDIDINNVESVKYLGVYIDRELKWNIQIEHMCSKIGKMIGFLGRLRYFVSESILRIIYTSIILPHFDYADVVWQSASKKYLNLMQKLQNRAGRIILKINPYSHVSTAHIHDILKWKKLDVRQLEHMNVMMFKILHDLAPEYMKRSILNKPNKYFLRNRSNLSLPKPRTNNCKRTFYYRAASSYNKLPLEIRGAPTIQSFKTSMQKYI